MENREGVFTLTASLISQTAFKQYLGHRDESYESLAAKVTMLGLKCKPPLRCSKATIGHLASGFVKGTNPVRAKLIEKALEAPIGSLFVYKVSRVSQDASRAA
jgi:hypothetical protein